MTTYNEFKQQVDRLIAPYSNGGISVNGKDHAKVVKSEIIAVQKELRNIKKLIGIEIQEARMEHKLRAHKAPYGLMGLLGGKSGASLAKKNSAIKRDTEILPLQNLQQLIDKLVIDFDRSKLNLDALISSK